MTMTDTPALLAATPDQQPSPETHKSPQHLVAVSAVDEVSRLATEARTRLTSGSLLQAMSSLSALPDVIAPLIGLLKSMWIAEASGDRDDDGPETAACAHGVYL